MDTGFRRYDDTKPFMCDSPVPHAYPLCNYVVKGRKNRFPAHFRSLPLVQVGRRAGGGAEWGPMAGFWRRFQWNWRSDGRVGGGRFALFGGGHWAGWRGSGWRVGYGALGNMVRMGKGLEQGGGVSEGVGAGGFQRARLRIAAGSRFTDRRFTRRRSGPAPPPVRPWCSGTPAFHAAGSRSGRTRSRSAPPVPGPPCGSGPG